MQWLFISFGVVIIVTFIILFLLNSPYLKWNYNDPEKAVVGVTFHAFKWIFIRATPIILIGLIIGIILIIKKVFKKILDFSSIF